MKNRILFILVILSTVSFSLFGQKITVTDIVGREVSVNAPAKRVILGEGRSLITLSLLFDDPSSVVVGWMSDFKKSGGLLYKDYEDKFPGIKNIKSIGAMGQETVSTEQIIALRPDLAIFSAGSHGPNAKSANTIRQLQAAGIPIVFIDFRLHPIQNTVPSIRILGKLMGKEKEAEAYIRYYESRIQDIQSKIAQNKNQRKPVVYMEMIRGKLSGSPGKGNLGEYITWLGGKNLGDVLPGELGELNAEYVISQQPDVYIATGIATPGEAGFVIGHGIGRETAMKSLEALTKRRVMQPLKAVRAGNVYGVWHLFYDSPLNLVAIEALAKYIQPELFSDMDLQKTIDVLNAQFLAVPLKGTYFLELKK